MKKDYGRSRAAFCPRIEETQCNGTARSRHREIAHNRDTARHYSAMGGEYRTTLLGGTSFGAAGTERLSA